MHIAIQPKYTAIFVLVVFLKGMFGIINTLHAQTFGASILTGVNISQVDGDFSAGYNKVGIEAGITGIAKLSSRIHTRIGLTYSERGALSRFMDYSSNDVMRIKLKYVAIPVEVVFNDWQHEDGYYRMQFFGGLSYGRLFDYSAIDNGVGIATADYNENDISWLVGGQYSMNKNWGIALKYTGSLNLLYNRQKNSGSVFPSMRGYLITLQLMYFLN